jgi:Leucine-rich repeat (LRR) protein
MHDRKMNACTYNRHKAEPPKPTKAKMFALSAWVGACLNVARCVAERKRIVVRSRLNGCYLGEIERSFLTMQQHASRLMKHELHASSQYLRMYKRMPSGEYVDIFLWGLEDDVQDLYIMWNVNAISRAFGFLQSLLPGFKVDNNKITVDVTRRGPNGVYNFIDDLDLFSEVCTVFNFTDDTKTCRIVNMHGLDLLPNLAELRIVGSWLSSLDLFREIQKLTKLTCLVVDTQRPCEHVRSELQFMNSLVGKLVNLEQLTVRGLLKGVLPSELGNLTKLREVDLCNNLISVPLALKLPNLLV